MAHTSNTTLLEALLDSWDRNNVILLNLLGAIPEGGLDARASSGSPTVGEMFAHIHYVRLVFVLEDAPDFAKKMPEKEWDAEWNLAQMQEMLRESSAAVRAAVRKKVEAGEEMKEHYDHPILFLQHMIWHEGYHHGQIKLALKLAGHPIPDDMAGPLTWDIWMNKTKM